MIDLSIHLFMHKKQIERNITCVYTLKYYMGAFQNDTTLPK